MKETDVLRRFLFDDLAVRGEWLNLTASWQAAKQHHQYPEAAMQKLGEALAAAVLLSATIKFDGTLILQAQGDGAIKSMVAQSTNKHEIRGWIRCSDTLPDDNLQNLLGDGYMALTIEPKKGEPYQGIVPLTGEHLAGAVENYFTQSEQLKTRLWLFANEHQAAGFLIQELPSEKGDQDLDDWTRIEALSNTISEEELLTLSCEDLLHRLFHNEELRLFAPETVSFKCHCSAEKVETTLLSLGREAIDEILVEQDTLVADCEFCSAKYSFDKVDVERVFAQNPVIKSSTTKH
ncbi:MAG: Hsp33 family molecular chaperone HslO [Methyloprofundus sp.]|nr:Hsp33 family molecular chaperone HslO [Methyloprofundus sp.]MBW6452732.1 Hsp33 family molecular chaperone HslO [Methyloprofundus sp.]